MSINQNIVLMTVLECGTDDLNILDDVRYDLGEITDRLISMEIKPTLNAIMGEVFRKGVDEIEQYINDRICELEAIPNERELDKDEEEELAKLRMLTPQKDIEWYCNCLDTHVYFRNNEDIYRLYLTCAIERVEENMGFSF